MTKKLFSEGVMVVEDYISISVDLQDNSVSWKSNIAYKEYILHEHIIQHHKQPPKTKITYFTLDSPHTKVWHGLHIIFKHNC